MPRTGVVERMLVRVLIRYWRRRDPLPPRELTFSPNPSDNVQMTMNLIMPLADSSALGKARLVQALAGAVPEVIAGLNNTQIVHNGRFVLVDDNLLMFSVYDGDFGNYIRDFILNIGEAFDVILSFVSDPPPLPVEEHPDEFIEWVRVHDAPQLAYWDIASLNPPDDRDLAKLPRRLVLGLDRDPNAQLFSYVAYPGVSAAKVREALGMGW
jgi:hypothetical protein